MVKLKSKIFINKIKMTTALVNTLSDVFQAGYSGTLPNTITVLKRDDTVVNKDAIFRFPRVGAFGNTNISDVDGTGTGLAFPGIWSFFVRGNLGSGIQIDFSIDKADNTWEILKSLNITATDSEVFMTLDDEIYPYSGADNHQIRLRAKSLSSSNPASNIDIEFFTKYENHAEVIENFLMAAA